MTSLMELVVISPQVQSRALSKLDNMGSPSSLRVE